MMIAGAASHAHGFHFTDPAQMAADIGTLPGPFTMRDLILLDDDQRGRAGHHGDLAFERLGIWRSAGLAHSLQLPWREARGVLRALPAFVIAAAAGIVLIPRAPLQLIILGVQVLAGVILPSAIIFLQLLLNDKEVLGDQFANKPWNNLGELDNYHSAVCAVAAAGGSSGCAPTVSECVEERENGDPDNGTG
jgi:hypothetical protein